jgi:hypothetical protein
MFVEHKKRELRFKIATPSFFPKPKKPDKNLL